MLIGDNGTDAPIKIDIGFAGQGLNRAASVEARRAFGDIFWDVRPFFKWGEVT